MVSGYINIPEYGAESWREPVATAVALPANGNHIGDVRVTVDTGNLYEWDGTSWNARTGGSGTVTSVSVVTANGFSGTVANPTTTPAITLYTTVTGILQGNGTAISNASTTGSGSVVLATSPTLITPNLGTPSVLVGTNITGTANSLTAGNINATSNSTLTTLSSLSLPTTQLTGTLQAAQFPALTGDVTTTAGSLTATIQPNVVTNAKLAQMNANTIKGNNTGSTANASDLTIAQVNTMLGDVTTIGAFGSTPNADGAIISGNTLTLEPADGTHPGGVSTTTQTFGGSKTLGASASDQTTIGAAASTALHQINGGLIVTTRTITADLTIDTTTSDLIIFCNASSAINVTLPTPTNGRELTIKDISGAASTNNITIVRHGSEQIEGLAASYVLQANYDSVTLVADGTNWWMV